MSGIFKMLKKEMDMKVFMFLSIMPIDCQRDGNRFLISKDFYTVKDGKVFLIRKDKTLVYENDTLFELHHKGIFVGDYQEDVDYWQKSFIVSGKDLLSSIETLKELN